MQLRSRLYSILSLVFLACFGGGCATGTPFAQVTPPQGHAVIYAYRPSAGYGGSGVNLEIKCDNVKFGELQSDAYVYTIVPTGVHHISSETESKSELNYNFESGKSYYIQADIELGLFIGRPKLTMVPEETGKLAILSTKYYVKPDANSPTPAVQTKPPTGRT